MKGKIKEYKVKLCKNCKHYEGVLKRGDNSIVMICAKYNLDRPISNEQQVEIIGELEYGCFEEEPIGDIVEAKPGFGGFSINLNKLLRKLFKK